MLFAVHTAEFRVVSAGGANSCTQQQNIGEKRCMKRSIILTTLIIPLLVLSAFLRTMRTQASPQGIVFNVNSTIDAIDADPGDGVCETGSSNGICTLRAAVQETNALLGKDSINLPSGDFSLTLTGVDEDLAVSGDLDILDDLIINGSEVNPSIIDGLNSDRVLHITLSKSVEISGITIQNGSTANSSMEWYGGGIYNEGILNITNTKVISNYVDGLGAGIFNKGSLKVFSNYFTNNNCLSDGAAIFNDSGNVQIINSTFFANSCYGGDPVYNRGNLFIANSLFKDNPGNFGSGGLGNFGTALVTNTVFLGGSTYDQGGAIENNGILTLINSSILSNTANGGIGGGIYNSNFLTLTNVTLSKNKSTYSSFPSQGFGGGIYNSSGTLMIFNSVITDNIANEFDGGGIFNSGNTTIVNSSINNNHAGFQGGGIANSGLLTISESVVDNNSSLGNGPGIANPCVP
jgi:hypothetical protein